MPAAFICLFDCCAAALPARRPHPLIQYDHATATPPPARTHLRAQRIAGGAADRAAISCAPPPACALRSPQARSPAPCCSSQAHAQPARRRERSARVVRRPPPLRGRRPPTHPAMDPQQRTVALCFSLNQDNSCFSAGTLSGFRVLNCEPFREQARARGAWAGCVIAREGERGRGEGGPTIPSPPPAPRSFGETLPTAGLGSWRCCSGATYWLWWGGGPHQSTRPTRCGERAVALGGGRRWRSRSLAPLLHPLPSMHLDHAARARPARQVMIWDDHQGRAIGELSFRSAVRAVRLRKDRVAVALEHKVGGCCCE